MKIRSRWLNVFGSSALTLAMVACGDDGSDGTTVDGGFDGGGSQGESADGSVAPDDTTDATGAGSDSGTQSVDVTLDQSDSSTDAGSADATDVVVLDASSMTDDSSDGDSGTDTTQNTSATDDTTTESDDGDASADQTPDGSSTDTTETASNSVDATDETTTTETNEPDSGDTVDTTTSTEQTDTSVVTDEQDASVDSGEETDSSTTDSTSDIQTSDVTTGASEAYWAQSNWSGYVFPFGAGQVTLNDGTVCVSGNEVGTVGLLYNVNQVENGEPSAYAPDGNDVGIDLSITSEIGGQVRFTAGGIEYCAQAVEGETFYFWFWDRFSDCATGTVDYDGQTPFESIGIVLSATGEYELCVDKFDVGELPDGGVLPVEAGVLLDASLLDPT